MMMDDCGYVHGVYGFGSVCRGRQSVIPIVTDLDAPAPVSLSGKLNVDVLYGNNRNMTSNLQGKYHDDETYTHISRRVS